MIAETEDDLIKRLIEWKDFVENRGMRVNMNKTKVIISGEWQKVTQLACVSVISGCWHSTVNSVVVFVDCSSGEKGT